MPPEIFPEMLSAVPSVRIRWLLAAQSCALPASVASSFGSAESVSAPPGPMRETPFKFLDVWCDVALRSRHSDGTIQPGSQYDAALKRSKVP